MKQSAVIMVGVIPVQMGDMLGALSITDALREVFQIMQEGEKDISGSGHLIEETGEPPVLYRDFSGGYGLGFFHVHSIPHHIF